MQKPQIPAVLLREKERKNEKGDIRFYATIIHPKCEDNKCKVIKKVLSYTASGLSNNSLLQSRSRE